MIVLLAGSACTQSPTPGQTTTRPAVNAPDSPKPAPASGAIARADALVEDLRRREAAEASRPRPSPSQISAPVATPPVSSSPVTTPPAPVSTLEATATTRPEAAAAAPLRDEAWWKERVRSLQATLDEELSKLAVMEKSNLKYGYNDAQAIYKKQVQAVSDARQAIDRVHDEARRAGVPPGWLRP
jgi:hypothetical protein